MRFIETAYAREQGPRNYQEDRFVLRDNLLAIADGMGGHARGDEAADAAMKVAESWDLSGMRRENMYEYLCDMVTQMHEDVTALADGDIWQRRQPGTTVVVVAIAQRTVEVVWLGDSRAYLLKSSGVLQPMTVDHSGPLGGLERCLGANQGFTEPSSSTARVNEGDRILLCTDGVINAVFARDDVLEKHGMDLDELMEHVKGMGLVDNTTIISGVVGDA